MAKDFLPEDVFVDYLLWMVTRDEEFLALYAQDILPDTFQTAEVTYLVEHAIDFYKTHEAPMPLDALIIMLAAEPEDRNLDKAAVVQCYEEATEPTDVMRGFVSTHAKGWFQRLAMVSAINQAGLLLENNQVLEARDLLSTAAIDNQTIGDVDFGLEMFLDLQTFFDEIEQNYVEQGNAIPCGMPTIDKILRGGLRPGELSLWMAGPQGGKSQALCYVAREAMLRGLNVVYFTLEMSPHIVLQRVWTGIIDMSMDDITLEWETAKKLIQGAAAGWEQSAWGSLLVKQYAAKTATVETLTTHLALLEKNGFQTDLLVVDYADILATKRHYGERRDELAGVYEDLRGLGQLAGIPIWSASQASREGVRRGTLDLTHISDSWDKAKIADYIFALCQDDHDKEFDEMRVVPLKLRTNAIEGPIKFNVDFSRSNFIDRGYMLSA
jgi:KaiC/GvpD/RAD55 family RecA-like ATPase